MGKTIAINPSWYWPDDVPRLLGVPPLRCERLMAERWARRRPGQPAIVEAGGAAGDAGAIAYGELWPRIAAAAAALRAGAPCPAADGPPVDRVLVCGPRGADGVIAVLAAIAAGRRPVLLAPDAPAESIAAIGATLAIAQPAAGAPASALAGTRAVTLGELEQAGTTTREEPATSPPGPVRSPAAPALAASGAPAGARGGAASDVHQPALELVSPDGLLVGHSHYSLVSGALSVAAFLGTDAGGWMSGLPLWTWEGLYAALVPLYLGATAVLADADGIGEDAASALDDFEVAYALAPYAILHDLARGRPRRLADAIRRNLGALLLAVDRPFAASERRKARKALDVPVLTVFGLAESGPILASHPSWYVDESVGIPLTNVEVQPANPQTGEPLETNWELLDYATMVIRAPLVMSGYEGPAAADPSLRGRLEDGWFKTGANASFDANGMMYLVDG